MTGEPHVIVLGNEKGGSGKSTTAMHMCIALARDGRQVGAMDLDLRQQSLFRYLENRDIHMLRTGTALPMPERGPVEPARHRSAPTRIGRTGRLSPTPSPRLAGPATSSS